MQQYPQTAADIMTTNVLTVGPDISIARARELMTQHGVRHLPVTSADGELIGVVTQKAMLGEVLRIADRFGIQGMAAQTRDRSVKEILGTDIETIQPQLPLAEAGRFFMTCKHGCLPVLDGGKLVGILTSADFVRLSVKLLEQAEPA